uniref:Uncharacterized protein n=1 Tax=Ditylum brightwellii TaxID=49249 RepID=A0A7S1Z972_9STRA|mmetsp:Transcript_27047/g.40172  ORF Transcript_27047/g.40172 Transcript_27047/m.40172 type:complete len:124 (+) Transcript_27047:1047-1418(+)
MDNKWEEKIYVIKKQSLYIAREYVLPEFFSYTTPYVSTLRLQNHSNPFSFWEDKKPNMSLSILRIFHSIQIQHHTLYIYSPLFDFVESMDIFTNIHTSPSCAQKSKHNQKRTLLSLFTALSIL